MKHGTLAGYNYWSCRCVECKHAINEYTKGRHRVRLEKIWELKTGPCVDCNQISNPWVMQFDHRGEDTKVDKISRMGTYSWQTVLNEIAKCDLVCANCHADRTYKRNLDSGKICAAEF